MSRMSMIKSLSLNPVREFYLCEVGSEDKVTLYLILLGFISGLLYCAINWLTLNYPGNNYVPHSWMELAPVFFGLYAFCLYVQKISPRTAFVVKAFCTNFLVIASILVIQSGAQFTPFGPIDSHLIRWDLALHYHTLDVLNWTYAHEHFKNILLQAYNSHVVQIVALPIILGLLHEKRSLYVMFWAAIISAFIGLSFYYFFPTTAPASYFNSLNFLPEQHATALKYQQIHQWISPTTYDGGMVAFPSFHVVWGVFFIYAYKNRLWLLLPMTVLNVLMIASTVLLGWHYLVDVISGISLGILSILLAEWFYSRFCMK